LDGTKAKRLWRLAARRRTVDRMLIFRLVFGLALVASVLCFAMYIGSSQVLWRQRGILILKWALIAAGGFFAVLIIERLARLL
jgi:hypothetical protein